MLWQHESMVSVLKIGGLLGVAIQCNEDEEPLLALIGEKRTFRIYFKTIQDASVIIEISFKDKYGKLVYATQSAGQGYQLFTEQQAGIICFDIALTLLLAQGGYSIGEQ
jgi:hypothetical protein